MCKTALGLILLLIASAPVQARPGTQADADYFASLLGKEYQQATFGCGGSPDARVQKACVDKQLLAYWRTITGVYGDIDYTPDFTQMVINASEA